LSEKQEILFLEMNMFKEGDAVIVCGRHEELRDFYGEIFHVLEVIKGYCYPYTLADKNGCLLDVSAKEIYPIIEE
jgi:hypothetical protein